MRYSNENKSKANGVVYTPSEMADYVARLMLRYADKNESTEVSILDPAVGEGELLVAVLSYLMGLSAGAEAVKMIVAGFIMFVIPIAGEWIVTAITALNIRMRDFIIS
ncbi:MAG: N-6 DNA methylase [Firmicutes bacterium]|nr:N-6 DNA methylase [Bacillota bacterium]